MPKKNYRTTFSFKKLQRQFPQLVTDAINVIGRRLTLSIKQGVDKGQDINGSPFERLSNNTKKLGGRKPLKRTGKLKKGLTLTQATISKPQFVIEMSAKSRGEVYGAFHNQGYTNSHKPKQWFKGAVIPKREWFGITKDMRTGGKNLKNAMAEISPRIASAWKKI